MSETENFTGRHKIEVTLIRHQRFYFLNLRLNGRPIINSKPIPRQGAIEIFEKNQNLADTYTTGHVDFSQEKTHEWTWTATRIEEAHEAATIIKAIQLAGSHKAP